LAADRNSIETRADCQVLFESFFAPAAYSLAPFAGNPFSDKARLYPIDALTVKRVFQFSKERLPGRASDLSLAR
jgi:hypothetical protein